MGVRGHNKLESFGFWRRKFCIKNAEIFAKAKSRSSQNLPGEKDESLQTAFHLHLLAEGGDVMYGKIVDIMLELAEA